MRGFAGPIRGVRLPVRQPMRRHPVVHAHGAQVKRLRALLESGEAATPRDENAKKDRKRRVVCAFGPHINRLREALEARFKTHKPEPAQEFEAAVADDFRETLLCKKKRPAHFVYSVQQAFCSVR